MASNCHFAFAVHVLSVLSLHADEAISSETLAISSETLAHSVNTNAVVIRRLLTELAKADIIETQRGPGGGSKLARPAGAISLLEIHRAVAGEVGSFGEHPNTPAQCCPVGHEIERVLEDVRARTCRAVEIEYSKLSLADVMQAVSAPQKSATRDT